MTHQQPPTTRASPLGRASTVVLLGLEMLSVTRWRVSSGCPHWRLCAGPTGRAGTKKTPRPLTSVLGVVPSNPSRGGSSSCSAFWQRGGSHCKHTWPVGRAAAEHRARQAVELAVSRKERKTECVPSVSWECSRVTKTNASEKRESAREWGKGAVSVLCLPRI